MNVVERVCVGIDVGKAKLNVALTVSGGKWRTKVVANTSTGVQDLLSWLAKHGAETAHVCMQATGGDWETVAEALADAGWTVSVIDPAQLQAFAGTAQARTKTGAADAKLIAQFCHRQSPGAWQPASPSLRRLRVLVADRDALVGLRTKEFSRLAVASVPEVREGLKRVQTMLDEQITELERRIAKALDEDPTLREQRELLASLPGLGDQTAA